MTIKGKLEERRNLHIYIKCILVISFYLLIINVKIELPYFSL